MINFVKGEIAYHLKREKERTEFIPLSMEMFSLVFGLHAAMMLIAGLVCAIEVKIFKRFEKKINKVDEKPIGEEITNEIDDVTETKEDGKTTDWPSRITHLTNLSIQRKHPEFKERKEEVAMGKKGSWHMRPGKYVWHVPKPHPPLGRIAGLHYCC